MWPPRPARAASAHSCSVWLPNSHFRTWLKVKKCIFVALLLKRNWAPKSLASQAKQGFKAERWLQKLSSKPSTAVFTHLARRAFTCVTKGRSRGLQDQILPSDTLQKLCAKYYLCLPSSVAPVKRSSVTATQKGHSSYPAETEGNTRDCWVSVSNNTQNIFIGTTFASTNINKATNESNRV